MDFNKIFVWSRTCPYRPKLMTDLNPKSGDFDRFLSKTEIDWLFISAIYEIRLLAVRPGSIELSSFPVVGRKNLVAIPILQTL